MDKVYICYISEDIKYDNQGKILGVFESFDMACNRRNNFNSNEGNNYMIADVEEFSIIKK